jgi:hypothetical protein
MPQQLGLRGNLLQIHHYGKDPSLPSEFTLYRQRSP